MSTERSEREGENQLSGAALSVVRKAGKTEWKACTRVNRKLWEELKLKLSNLCFFLRIVKMNHLSGLTSEFEILSIFYICRSFQFCQVFNFFQFSVFSDFQFCPIFNFIQYSILVIFSTILRQITIFVMIFRFFNFLT